MIDPAPRPAPPTYEDLQRELAAARAELHALRWLLPAARLLRRSHPGPASAPPPAAPPPATVATPSAAAPRATGMRGVALAAYRVARPVVRPMAWRSRSFLTGQVMAELHELRAKMDTVLERTGDHRGLDPGVVIAVERALLTLALESRRDPRP